MSDVPDLDRLIEEHEIFKYNMQWNRREAFHFAMFRGMITLVVTVLLVGFLGVWGVPAVPLVWKWLCVSLPTPPPRDPFRRYMVK